MNRVLLLLDQARNRALVADWLGDRYEAILPDRADPLGTDFDLGIIDGLALDRLRDQVQARRRREEPVFLPFLLVTSRPDVRMVTRHIWRTIDELILTPIEKLELRLRVEILLRARRYSLALRDRIRETERQRRRAEAALESKARLIRGLSHDLKNPLGAIQGYAALLVESAKGPDGAERRDWLRRIARATDGALHILDDLLELSRAESGTLRIEPVETELGAVVRDIADDHAATAGARSIDIHVDTVPDRIHCRTDPNRIRQILDNLLSNAIKYSPEGGSVEVRVERRDGGEALRSGPMIAIAVSDSGPGIPPEDQERIFEEFTRLRDRDEPGAGLGLAISRTVARLMGGDITVRSRPGRGSTFTLWLPLETPRTAGAEPPRRAA